MIHGNGWGIGLALIGGLAGGMSSYFLKLADPQALLVVGAVWTVLDGLLRVLRRRLPGALFDRQIGGVVWFLPVWALGIVLMVGVGVRALAGS